MLNLIQHNKNNIYGALLPAAAAAASSTVQVNGKSRNQVSRTGSDHEVECAPTRPASWPREPPPPPKEDPRDIGKGNIWLKKIHH